MAKKKDKTMVWVLVIAGAGAAYWYLTKQTAAPLTTTVPTLPTTAPISPLPAPNVQTTPITQTIAPTISSPTVASSASMPNDSQLQTLQQWAQSSLNACDLARWNNMQSGFSADASQYGYPSEWQGLVDIYFNDWVGGQGATDQRTQFWDFWRNKYSILTNTSC